MPPSKEIKTPTPYAEWVKNPQFFPDGSRLTRTVSHNGPQPGTRWVWGLTSPVEYWFFIAMTTAEEDEFWKLHGVWRAANPNPNGVHEIAVFSTKPKDCGTPYTPPCPPDPPLAGAIEELAELAAGPAASDQVIEDKKTQIANSVVALLDGLAVAFKPPA